MNDTGILLFHGFAGDIEEVEPLRGYLAQKGYDVECPLLPGHGKRKQKLSETSYGDWIAAAESAYIHLSNRCRKVVAVGFSMGGLLAINLWNYGLAGLVTVNMPIYYWNPKLIVLNLIRDFRQYWKKYLKASTDKSFCSMIEFQKLLTKTKPMIGNITCKTMVIQARDDDTVHYKSADYILRKFRGHRTAFRPDCGGHTIFQSESSAAVCSRIEEFIRTC